MLLSSPMPFRQALQSVAVRRVWPTSLGSAELRELNKSILDRAFFSARNTLEGFLDQAKADLQTLLNPETRTREDGSQYTAGTNVASVRLGLKEKLRELGYQASDKDAGTIKDFASDQRLNLVITTNAQIAQGFGYARQGQETAILDQWPCQELFRAEERKQERDWGRRWLEAARAAGDEGAIRCYGATGRMVARKDSGIWQALGDGAGGYDDTLGNSFSPFAFGSGMDARDVDRDESITLGLIDRDTQIAPVALSYGMEEN